MEKECEASSTCQCSNAPDFLGIVKTVTLHIQSWAKLRGKNRSFLSHMGGVLESLAVFNLNWLKVLGYQGGKMGGWVSENYIALSRVYKWVYSLLEVAAEYVQYVQPTTPHTQWTAHQCEKWLCARGLDKSGKSEDKKSRVQQHMRFPGGPPEILRPKGGSVLDVINVVKSMQAMISHVMSENVNDDVIDEMSRHIIFFLSMFHRMDDNMDK